MNPFFNKAVDVFFLLLVCSGFTLAVDGKDPVIEPEKIAVKPGAPLSLRALVANPPAIKGVQSWSLESRDHRGRYINADVSPDGKWVATGGVDGTIRIWELSTGKLEKALIGNDGYVYGLAFSPGGRYLACGGSTGVAVQIWEVATGRLVKLLKGHTHHVGLVAWTSDGKTIVGAGGASGDVSIWDIATGVKKAKTALGRPVTSIAIHPDNTKVAAVSVASEILVLSITTAKSVQTLGEQGNNYVSLAWSPSGKHLAAGGAKDSWVFDHTTGEIAHTFGKIINSMDWSEAGDKLVTASSAERLIRVWNTADFKEISKTPVHSTWLRFLPGDSQIVTGDTVGIGVINPAVSKQSIRHEITGVIPPIWTYGKPLLSGIGTLTITLWDPVTGKPLHKLEGHKAAVTAYAWSPDGKNLATASGDKNVIIWNVATGTSVHTLTQHTLPVSCVAWSPDGKEIATGSRDKAVYIWNALTGAQVQALTGHRDEVASVAWSPSSNTLAVGVRDGTVIPYPRATWKPGKAWTSEPIKNIASVAWSADGRSIAACDIDGDTGVWAVATGKMLEITGGGNSGVQSMFFYPKGDMLAIGRNYGVEIWDLQPLKRLNVFSALGYVQQINWNPSGPSIAVSSADRMCRFFEAESGRLRGIILAEEDHLVTISSEGQFRADGQKTELLVYVAQTDKGQETYTPSEFATKYGWRNDPAKARVTGK